MKKQKMFNESEWTKFRDALAMVESGNNPSIIGGDGCGIGRWQIHPVWLYRYKVPPRSGDSWDTYLERCLERFFFMQRYSINGPWAFSARVIAMLFHVGHLTYPDYPDWDVDYDERFKRALLTAEYGAKSSAKEGGEGREGYDLSGRVGVEEDRPDQRLESPKTDFGGWLQAAKQQVRDNKNCISCSETLTEKNRRGLYCIQCAEEVSSE